MPAIGDAIQVLKKAEGSLRTLVSDAVKEGDYESVLRITAWAKGIREFLGRSEADQPSKELLTGAVFHTAAQPGMADAGGYKAVDPIEPAPIEPATRRNTRKRDYPKYFRNGSILVKLGWSKNRKLEYEHKAPFSVVEELAKAISLVSSEKYRFAMDGILPLKNPADGREIPSYQTYACLGWLRQMGLIKQHGRQGYSVKSNTDLNLVIQQLFTRLPEQQFSAGQS